MKCHRSETVYASFCTSHLEVGSQNTERDVIHSTEIIFASEMNLLLFCVAVKVVSVSRTPGHTKHFQTIFLTRNVRLCDSPGLVFPSVVARPLQVCIAVQLTIAVVFCLSVKFSRIGCMHSFCCLHTGYPVLIGTLR